jgi:serine/threonine-protein kinase
MSSVYQAEDLYLSRAIALKVLGPVLSDDGNFRRRFVEEARTIGRLADPHIVPIHNFGDAQTLLTSDDRLRWGIDESALVLDMRLVDGPDLSRLIQRDGPLNVRRVARLLEQVGAALNKAHTAGVIHRDVKPSNVLVEDPGSVDEHFYLADFGIAKEVTADKGFTATGQFIGSYDYAAPEQFEGGRIDARTDIYALGGSVFTFLTGLVPYERDTWIEKVTAHLKDPPPTIRHHLPEMSPEIDGAIAKAMAKDPNQRYQSSRQFSDAFRSAVASRIPTVASKTSAAPSPVSAPTLELPGQDRRKKWVVPIVVGLFALTVIGAVALAMRKDRLEPSPRVPADTINEAQRSTSTPTVTLGPDLVVFPSLPDDPDASAIAETLASFYTAINFGEYGQAYDLLSSQRRSKQSEDAFAAGYRTSHTTDHELLSIFERDRRRKVAHMTMKSIQEPKYGSDGHGCTLWNLDVVMKLFAGRWQIDSADGHGGDQASKPCVEEAD